MGSTGRSRPARAAARRPARACPAAAPQGHDVGIRAFFRAHPPGADFTDLIARARARAAATGYPRSPVGACAAVLLAEGQRGVRAVAAKVAEGTGVATVPDAAVFRRLRPQD